jgi:Arc/MetJ-type ribon-helix-helix transcriptional regulator
MEKNKHYKISTVSITKIQTHVIEYMNELGYFSSKSEIVREAIHHFLLNITRKINNIEIKPFIVSPRSFFKHLQPYRFESLWDNNALTSRCSEPFTVNVHETIWNVLNDLVIQMKFDSRSAIIREALNEYLKEQFIMIETTCMIKNKETGINIPVKNKNVIDMRRIGLKRDNHSWQEN